MQCRNGKTFKNNLGEDYSIENIKSAIEKTSSLPILLVQIDEGSYKGISFDSNLPRVIAISPKTYTFKYNNVKYSRTQLPIILSKYNTIHKCQSLSEENIVWVLDKFWTWSLAYVAISRVRTPEGLVIGSNCAQ